MNVTCPALEVEPVTEIELGPPDSVTQLVQAPIGLPQLTVTSRLPIGGGGNVTVAFVVAPCVTDAVVLALCPDFVPVMVYPAPAGTVNETFPLVSVTPEKLMLFGPPVTSTVAPLTPAEDCWTLTASVPVGQGVNWRVNVPVVFVG